MSYLIFDVETVPDVEFGRRWLDLHDLDDNGVAEGMFFRQKQKTDTEFLPHYQHRVVAISVVMHSHDDLRVWSLGDIDSDEKEIITRFFDGLERFTPELVSWNGGGFDLPVLHYRALRHGVACPRYWEIGDDDRSFRYNNYLNRFHWRHIDLMEVLAGYQFRANASLDSIATLLGFPGKMGIAGDQVWPLYQQGKLQSIRDYCETDVLNTFLIFLKFQHMRGLIDDARLATEFQRVETVLEASGAAHLGEFLSAWRLAREH